MTKQLYEEALADIKRLKEVAEDSALRSLTAAVTPRIREFIEQELLRENGEFDEEDELGAPGSEPPVGDLMTDVNPMSSMPGVGGDVASPDEEGKVTLDLDTLGDEPEVPGEAVEPPMFGSPVPEDDEYEMNFESVAALSPVLKASKGNIIKELESGLYRLGERVQLFKGAGKLVRESANFNEQIARMISHVENMYGYVQESVTVPARKKSYEIKLEALFQELNKLQEQKKMSKKSLKKMMNEGDVTLKLTGLPDELDLDSVGVDLITGEEDGEEGGDLEGGDDLDFGGDEGGEGDEDGEGGDDLDLDALGGGDEGEEEMGESRELSDNTIVEIDEGMLRREIARMKSLREDAVPSTKGAGPGKAVKDFGGGHDEGDPWLDGDVTTEGEEEDMDESQENLDEVDGDEEGELTVDEVQEPEVSTESLKRRVAFEKRLQERAKARGAALKKEAAGTRNPKKIAALRSEYSKVVTRFNESVARAKKFNKLVVESTKRAKVATKNVATRRLAENADSNLRAKLAETNLFNAKLLYSNKLLQNDVLSKRQKSEIIERLDEANSLREVKLVYESLVKTMAGTARPLSEGTTRKVIGSASRTTRPASTNLSEGASGYETDRWAELAGINRKR